MNTRLIGVAGAALLLSVTLVGAAERGGWSSQSGSAASTAARAAANRPANIPAQVTPHANGHVPNSHAWGGGHPNAQGTVNQGPRGVAPFNGNIGPRVGGAGPQVIYPPSRFPRRNVRITVLAPLIIGTTYFYPYRYLPYDGPVCGGVTENGCELRWMDVPLEDGSETVPQCVEFCPQQ